MTKHDLKFIKGECLAGQPANICFYTDVETWSVWDFLNEFDWLTNHVHPSKIIIHINSAGGSVIDGISVFSKIIDCPIPTACVNDGLAGSMGSIIWAAGDDLYMKDYALLMIHNPFCGCCEDKEYNQITDAFKQQLKTIYIKRFNLSDQEVEDIMNGKKGEDGTFLTAEQAVEKGFIKADHIIETPAAIKDKIYAALKDSTDLSQIKAVYGLVGSTLSSVTINEQNNNLNSSQMENDKTTIFAALVGLTGEQATVDNVTAKINSLKTAAAKAESMQKSLDNANSELTKIKAELTGAQTSVKNLTESLEATKDALKKYQEAETKAKAEKVNNLIEQAIADCKINKDERDAYTQMAQDNFELAQNVLAKIPARDNLGNIISEANKKEAKDNVITEEQKIFARVEDVVGKDFAFRTLS